MSSLTWKLEMELGSFGRAASTLNHLFSPGTVSQDVCLSCGVSKAWPSLCGIMTLLITDGSFRTEKVPGPR